MFIERTPIKILQKRWKLIIFSGVLVALASLFITLAFPLKYRADAQVLIIAKSRTGVDPYTIVKSAERIGENISQVVGTNDFYEKVRLQSSSNFDWSLFEKMTEKDKRKLWQKEANTSVVYGTGVLNINTYHKDKTQAKELADAVANTLVSRGWEYVGVDVTIKVVNDAVVTNWPVKPNLVINTILGFIAGVLVMAGLNLKKNFKN